MKMFIFLVFLLISCDNKMDQKETNSTRSDLYGELKANAPEESKKFLFIKGKWKASITLKLRTGLTDVGSGSVVGEIGVDSLTFERHFNVDMKVTDDFNGIDYHKYNETSGKWDMYYRVGTNDYLKGTEGHFTSDSVYIEVNPPQYTRDEGYNYFETTFTKVSENEYIETGRQFFNDDFILEDAWFAKYTRIVN